MVFEPPARAGDDVERPLRRASGGVVGERLHLVPPLRRRAVRVPFGLHHPVWVEDPDFDLELPSAPVEPARTRRSDRALRFRGRTGRSSARSRPSPVGDARGRGTRVRSLRRRDKAPPCRHRRGVGGRRSSPPSSISGPESRVVAPPPDPWQPEQLPNERDLVGGGPVVARRVNPNERRPPCGALSAPSSASPSATDGCARRTASNRRPLRSAHHGRRSTVPSRPTGVSPSSRRHWTRSRPCGTPSEVP